MLPYPLNRHIVEIPLLDATKLEYPVRFGVFTCETRPMKLIDGICFDKYTVGPDTRIYAYTIPTDTDVAIYVRNPGTVKEILVDTEGDAGKAHVVLTKEESKIALKLSQTEQSVVLNFRGVGDKAIYAGTEPFSVHIQAECNHLQRNVYEVDEPYLRTGLDKFVKQLRSTPDASSGSWKFTDPDVSIRSGNRTAYRTAVCFLMVKAPAWDEPHMDSSIARHGFMHELCIFYVILHHPERSKDVVLYEFTSNISRNTVVVTWRECSDDASAWRTLHNEPSVHYERLNKIIRCERSRITFL